MTVHTKAQHTNFHITSIDPSITSLIKFAFLVISLNSIITLIWRCLIHTYTNCQYSAIVKPEGSTPLLTPKSSCGLNSRPSLRPPTSTILPADPSRCTRTLPTHRLRVTFSTVSWLPFVRGCKIKADVWIALPWDLTFARRSNYEGSPLGCEVVSFPTW
jgi:hypothetical protein